MGKRKRNKNNLKQIIGIILFIILATAIGYFEPDFIQDTNNLNSKNNEQIKDVVSYNLSDIPEYKDNLYIIINDNIPNFDEKDYTTESFEKYSELDVLGRCGVAYANICRETMPPEGDKRGEISSVYPTGWKQKKYDGEYLYNRCHLIGYQLSDEDANELNLITGTRYFNVSGMLPFENQVADYIKAQDENENKHVLYRVTPVFEGNNLLAKRSSNGSIFC